MLSYGLPQPMLQSSGFSIPLSHQQTEFYEAIHAHLVSLKLHLIHVMVV